MCETRFVEFEVRYRGKTREDPGRYAEQAAVRRAFRLDFLLGLHVHHDDAKLLVLVEEDPLLEGTAFGWEVVGLTFDQALERLRVAGGGAATLIAVAEPHEGPSMSLALVGVLARDMFVAYNEQSPNPWTTHDGRPVPRWEELNDQVRDKWAAAARLAIAVLTPRKLA